MDQHFVGQLPCTPVGLLHRAQFAICAVCYKDTSIFALDDDGKLTPLQGGPTRDVQQAVAFSSDSGVFLAVGEAAEPEGISVQLWTVSGDEKSHGDENRMVTSVGEGKHLSTNSIVNIKVRSAGKPQVLVLEQTRDFVLYDVNDAEMVETYRGMSGATRNLCGELDPHNIRVFLISTEAGVKLWDLRAQRPVLQNLMQVPTDKPFLRQRCLQFSTTNPTLIASGGDNGVVQIWDRRKMEEDPVQKLREGHNHWVTKLAWHPYHDDVLLSAGLDGHVQLWRCLGETLKPVATLTHKDAVIDLDWRADDWKFLCLGADRAVIHAAVGFDARSNVLA